MNNALYLLAVWGLIPLAVIVLALFGRPVLVAPHRLFVRLTPEQAYRRGVITLALVGAATLIALTLQLAFSTGGQTFPPIEYLKLNWRFLYLFLLLIGVPLVVVGLITKGRRFLIWPSRASLGILSEEGAYALSAAGVIIIGAALEVLLLVQLA